MPVHILPSAAPNAPSNISIDTDTEQPHVIVHWDHNSTCTASTFLLTVYNEHGEAIVSEPSNSTTWRWSNPIQCTPHYVTITTISETTGVNASTNSHKFTSKPPPNAPSNISIDTDTEQPHVIVHWDHNSTCTASTFLLTVYNEHGEAIVSEPSNSTTWRWSNPIQCTPHYVTITTISETTGVNASTNSHKFTSKPRESDFPQPSSCIQQQSNMHVHMRKHNRHAHALSSSHINTHAQSRRNN
ncbi:unnamed protein product [Dicrocoelium dendriticum]|nr:unnamed protein product [Dicrocoelium dendriticum]